MKDFLTNILSSPPKIKPGQLWYSSKMKTHLLVLDSQFAETLGVVRGMAITSIYEAADQHDVIIDFGGKKAILRASQGPIPVNQLTYYTGTVSGTKFKKALESEKITAYNYTPEQFEVIEEVINALTPLRSEALKMIERNQVAERVPLVIPLYKHWGKAVVQTLFTYDLAAANAATLQKQQEFWSPERKARSSAFPVISDSDMQVRFALLKDQLFLVAYSKKIKKISNIQLHSENKNVTIKPEPLIIELEKEERGFVLFKHNEISPGKWILSFTVDSKKFKKEVEFLWKK